MNISDERKKIRNGFRSVCKPAGSHFQTVADTQK